MASRARWTSLAVLGVIAGCSVYDASLLVGGQGGAAPIGAGASGGSVAEGGSAGSSGGAGRS